MKRDFVGIATFLLVSVGIASISWRVAERPQSQQEVIKKVASDSIYSRFIDTIYHQTHLDSAGLSEAVFEKALTGFYNMKYSGLLHSKPILTIADFDQLSRRKRLYIIDVEKRKLLINTWVSHGQNSGGDLPDTFSNVPNSNQSSIGFFLTGEIYYGKHGRSLKLDGMDAGFNNNARERSIVVHGAEYVSQKTIDELGRLGRSQGCPAVPLKLANHIIDVISGRTVLFINSSEQLYHSSFLNELLAASVALHENEILAIAMD